MISINSARVKILRKLLEKQCPNEIPRSGDKGRSVNCFSVSVNAGETPLLLVNMVSDHGVSGAYFEGSGFYHNASIPFSLMYGVEIIVEHYHGLSTHEYKGLLRFLFFKLTGLYLLVCMLDWVKRYIPQKLYNYKRLDIKSRIAVLRKVIAKQSEAPEASFDISDIMTFLYGIRWYSHPRKNEAKKKVGLYLTSFVASGELVALSAGRYKMTGMAIVTLDNYQIEMARAESVARSQRWLVVLTLMLAFFSAVQAGIITTTLKIHINIFSEGLGDR